MKEKKSLYEWIWNSYLKTALIPLILIELVFLIIYFSSTHFSQKDMIKFLKLGVTNDLTNLSEKESINIENQLIGIRNTTDLFRNEIVRIFKDNQTSNQPNLLKYSETEAYYTYKDIQEGGAAVFYSGIYKIGKKEREKVQKLLGAQNLMKNIKDTQPLVVSVYFNSYDSLNVIYPYFDVISQYTEKMDIPTFNFYYEADFAHNPQGKVVWTDAYLDPAGNGWMASAIAPVYSNKVLEGVVGLDVTIDNIVNQVLDIKVPYEGYALLLGKDGSILALPKDGEKDWGISELTSHNYTEAIKSDTFKPSEFNVFNKKELLNFGNKLKNNSRGLEFIELNKNSQAVSWYTINETGWKLLLVIPEKNIYKKIDELSKQFLKIGLFMISGLTIFYILFFQNLSKKAKKMSKFIAEPLEKLEMISSEIGKGVYNQQVPQIDVTELYSAGKALVKMGEDLGSTNRVVIETKEKLQLSESTLKTLINSIDDILLEISFDGEILNVWSKNENRLTSAYLSGVTNIYSVFEKNVADTIMNKVNSVLETGMSEVIEYTFETNGGLSWFQANISRLENSDNIVVLSSRDITKLKEVERSLVSAKNEADKANAAKSQFLSNMSHELRTPLNSIVGFAQILLMDTLSPVSQDQKESIEEILKSGRHLLSLINEILDLARIESGKLTLSMEPVKVKSILEEVLSMMKPMAEFANVDLKIDLDVCDTCYIYADWTRTKQVLINLISNAIKYNKNYGYVNVYCEKTVNNKFRINIIDNGIGISKEHLANIFKPFYRINSLSSTVEGTGIGLSVAQQLVNAMNGIIDVESEIERGTHFWIDLDFAENIVAFDENIKNIPIDDETGDTNKVLKKILYIEDNPSNLKLVESIIKQISNFELISGNNGEICLPLAKLHKPQLILLDINLPGIDGFEVFKQLASDQETRDIPVIALSASAMSSDIEKGLHMGFRDYLTKPFDVEKFLLKISNIVE